MYLDLKTNLLIFMQDNGHKWKEHIFDKGLNKAINKYSPILDPWLLKQDDNYRLSSMNWKKTEYV